MSTAAILAYIEHPEAFWPASDFPTKAAHERARAIGHVAEERYRARAARLDGERRAIAMLERLPAWMPSFERQYAILRWRHPQVNPDRLRLAIAIALTESSRALVEATGDRAYEDYRAVWRGWKPRKQPKPSVETGPAKGSLYVRWIHG